MNLTFSLFLYLQRLTWLGCAIEFFSLHYNSCHPSLYWNSSWCWIICHLYKHYNWISKKGKLFLGTGNIMMLCFISVIFIFMCNYLCFASSAYRPHWINFPQILAKIQKKNPPEPDYFLYFFFWFDSNAIAKYDFWWCIWFMLILHMKTHDQQSGW